MTCVKIIIKFCILKNTGSEAQHMKSLSIFLSEDSQESTLNQKSTLTHGGSNGLGGNAISNKYILIFFHKVAEVLDD